MIVFHKGINMYKQIIITVFIISFSIFSNLTCFARSFTYFAFQDDKFKESYEKGEEYIEKKKFSEAAKAFEEAYKINPNQMQAIEQLCSCYTELKQYDKLQELSKKGLLIAQNQLNTYYISRFYSYLGISYKSLENYKEAIKNIQYAIINNKYYIDDYYNLYYCYFKLEKYDLALKALDLIKKLNSEYYNEKKLEKEREQLFKTALEKDFILNHSQIATNYSKEKNYSAAINEYKQILSKKPDDTISLSEIINNELLSSSSNDKEIIDYCKKLINELDKKHSDDDYKHYDIAYKGLCYCYKLQNNSKLLSEYEKLSNCFNHIKKAKENISKDYTEDAIYEYKLAIESISNLNEVPYNYSALDGIIDLYFNMQDYEGTKKYIQLGLNQAKKDKNKSKFINYCKNIASYYYLSEKYKDAIKSYQKVLEMATEADDISKSYLGLGNTYSLLEKNQEALNYYEKYKESLKNDSFLEVTCDIDSKIIKHKTLLDENSDVSLAKNHYYKATDYYNSQQFNEAIEEYAKSLQYIPENTNVLRYLSLSLHTLKRHDEAYEVDTIGYNISLRDHDNSNLDVFCFGLGGYYLNYEDYRTSLYYFNQIPRENSIMYNEHTMSLIGICHVLLDELDEALEVFEEAHNLYPNSIEIAHQLEKCRKMINEQ